ncbi:MAG: glutaredoxin family protein [Curvibacter sp.]|jgi:glutaredoxin|nr:glutaredoxin family protein [Curvibacter sp.]
MNLAPRLCFSTRPAIIAVLALLPLLAAPQPVYRIVGPDGRVTFTDKPPTGAGRATTMGPGGRASQGGGPTLADLPIELRQAMGRYPVTLYSGDNCLPCDDGRTLLNSRGIPVTEKMVKTSKDAEALKAITQQQSLPVLTIGGQVLTGYSPLEWGQYLDAAGYPKTSQLPSSYRNPPVTPLVPLVEAAPAQAPASSPSEQPAAPEAPPLPPLGPAPGNPTGIVF